MTSKVEKLSSTNTLSAPGQVLHDIETITPRIAEEYLRFAGINRSISEPAVVRYATAMEKGQWSLAQPIIFDQYGKLIDGQHRLAAVVRSGIPQRFNVLRGIDAIRHMDAGRPRRPADVLHMMGYKNAPHLAAITRAVMFKEANPTVAPIAQGSTTATVTIDDVVERVEADPELITVTRLITGPYKSFSRMLKSAATAGWFIYTLRKQMQDNELLGDFMAEIMGDIPSKDSSPAAVLYRTLNNARSNQRRLSKAERAAFLVKAWNAYYENREVSRLVYNPFGKKAEKFPTLLTDVEVGS